jgi:hypothetical protein
MNGHNSFNLIEITKCFIILRIKLNKAIRNVDTNTLKIKEVGCLLFGVNYGIYMV